MYLTRRNVVNAKDKAENPFKLDDGKWKISFIWIIQHILHIHRMDAVSLHIRLRHHTKLTLYEPQLRHELHKWNCKAWRKKCKAAKKKQHRQRRKTIIFVNAP